VLRLERLDRLIHYLVNALAAISVAGAVAVARAANGPPIHIGESRFWICASGPSIWIETPSGSGRETAFISEGAATLAFFGFFPLWWVKRRWVSRAGFRACGQTVPFPTSLLLILLLAWYPLVLLIQGPWEVGDRALLAFAFGALSLLGICAWPPARLVERRVRKYLERLQMRRGRIDGPRCMKCGYLLIGNLSGICPECGSNMAAKA